MRSRRDALREEWVRAVNELADEVSAWAREEPGWEVSTATAEIDEEPLGAYAVPVVTINTPSGRLLLEAIARNWGGRGIIEFYAWPTLHRVRLLSHLSGDSWQIWTDSGIPLRREWNRENFIQLSRDLLDAPL